MAWENMGFLRNSPKSSPKDSPKMGFLRNSPKSSPKDSPRNSPRKTRSNTLQYLFDLDSNGRNTNGNSSPISSLSIPGSIGQSSSESKNEEILTIISHCGSIFTFTDPTESPSQQDHKRLKLIQLLSYLKSSKKTLPDIVLAPLVSMIAANLFRPLCPYLCHLFTGDFPDDEELVCSLLPTWQHLQVVYDILLKLVQNSNQGALKNYINQPFLVNLLSLFQSEDPRERESLKNVYHQIYSKFTIHRAFMRKSMNDVFLHYVFETERHCGIGELLEIWGSIINGFTVPLKGEHKLFLMRVLIPLHKTKGMQVYHRQLSYCVNQFVQKEPVVCGVVVRGILRYWPVTNCQKEVLLIGELEELVENIDPDQYKMLALPLCTRITKCLNSWNSQVAERALYVWNNKQFVKMATVLRKEVFPVVVEGMEKNLKWHWNNSVKQLTHNVKAMLEEMDPILYEKCLQEMYHRKYLARQEEAKRKAKWERIECEAAKNHPLHHQYHTPQKWHLYLTSY